MKTIKIGKNEYKIGPLNAYDLDIVIEGYKDKNISKLKQSFTIFLYCIKLYNPEIKMELADLMKSCPIEEIDKIVEEFNEVTGVNFILKKKIS